MNEKIILERAGKIRAQMAENGWDVLLVTSPENHRYVSGFHNPDGMVALTKDGAAAYADFRYTEAARRELPAWFEVISDREEFLRRYASGKTVAFEDERLSYASYLQLQKELSGSVLAPAGETLLRMRAVKSEEEVASIVRAQRIAERALEKVLGILSPKMTETEVAAELEYAMKKAGSEDKSFDTIAVSGSNSSSPHGVPRPVRLEKGFLTMDFGAVVDGYHSDMTRTVVIGKADEKIKHVYETVLLAQTKAIEAMVPGAKNREVDGVARKIIDGAGYEGKFGHSLGHGVGLEIHEKPTLSPKSGEAVLHIGEVVTSEPGIYLEGLYGCRIEDMILIGPSGPVNLTKAPKDLIEI